MFKKLFQIILLHINNYFRNNVLCISILLIITLSSSSLYAQEKISLNLKNAPITQLINKIQQQSKFNIIADQELIKNALPITIKLKNKDIISVIAELNKVSEIFFEFDDSTIYLKAKKINTVLNNKTGNIIVERRKINGIITTQEKELIGGVTIQNIYNRRQSAISDNNGHFTIEVTSNPLLSFTSVGYKNQTFQVKEEDNLKIILEKSNNDIKTVVVNTGYNKKKWNLFTGTASIIKKQDIEKFQHNNIFKILQSLDPSFKIEENIFQGSNPNFIPEINIRGINNVGNYTVNSPLLIIDGFQYDLDVLFDIDVNLIESITLLKDASSTVLYGSRGGNGVLVVETKKPTRGDLKFTYNFKSILETADLSSYNLMNSEQKLKFEKLTGSYNANRELSNEEYFEQQYYLNEIYENRKSNVQSGINTNWIIQPISEKIATHNSLRVEGGNKILFSIHGNYNDQFGVMKSSGRTRKSVNFNLEYNTDKLNIRGTNAIFSTIARHTRFGELQDYAIMNPYQKLVDKNGLIQIYPDEQNLLNRYNPIYNASLPFKNLDKKLTYIQNFFIQYSINPEIKIKSTYNFSNSKENNSKYISPNHSNYINQPNKGEFNIGNGKNRSNTINVNLDYTKTFENNYLNFNLISEYRQSRYTIHEHLYSGIDEKNDMQIDSAKLNSKAHSSNTFGLNSKLISYIFSGNYAYKEKYQVDFSYRIDGSSKFGYNNPYGNFWTVGFGYDMKEDIFKHFDWINNVRLFTNTGVTGTDAFLTNMTLSSIINPSRNIYYDQIGYLYDNEGNKNLKWPQIKAWNVGLRSRLFDEKLFISISSYKKNTNRMISLVTAAPSLGLPEETYYNNKGMITNLGFESEFYIKLYQNSRTNFFTDLTFTINHNQSKLVEISEELELLNKTNLQFDKFNNPIQTTFYKQGESVNNFKGLNSIGVDPITKKEFYYDKYGNITDFWNESDITVIGNKDPLFFGTLSSSITYSDFSLYAFMNYSISGDIYNFTKMNRIENLDPWLNTDKNILSSEWQYKNFNQDNASSKSLLSSRFIEKQNIIRLSTISLSYQVQNNFIKKLRLKQLKLQTTLNDLFSFTNSKQELGIIYPYSKNFILGINAQF